MGMTKGTHVSVQLRKDTWKELMRIKYARDFKTVDDVILDLLDDDPMEVEQVDE